MANLTRNTGTGLPYKLYQDNRTNSNHRGEWYARAKSAGTVDLDGLAEHIARHGSGVTKAEMAGVLYTLQDCIMELLLSGQRVKLGDLGTFYLTIRSKPAPTRAGFNVAEHIDGVRLRFLPSQADDAGLTATRLCDSVRFIDVDELAGGEDADGGGQGGQTGGGGE